MGLKIGIVGLPNVGKSTLFKALTAQPVEIANYPFATIDPNVGIVTVPDKRLDALARMSQSAKIIPGVVEFVDIAGLVKGAAHGEGLGNQFLAHIREADAIAEVVRVFEDRDIIHVSSTPNPADDIETIEYELILKDCETMARRLHEADTEAKTRKKDAEETAHILRKINAALKAGTSARDALRHLNPEERTSASPALASLELLTAKPVIYIFNISEKKMGSWTPDPALEQKIGNAPWVAVAARLEAELADLTDAERAEYLAALGLKGGGRENLIRIAYQTLGLITFFTTGEKETRAWTIRRGATAPQAGRAIHSDFEDKFIRAEVIAYDKLLEAASWTSARDKGWIRTEGKEYIVQDGDVMIFKI